MEREDDIATVAFWYQVGQPKRFTQLPPLSKRILPDLDKTIEASHFRSSARHTPGVVEIQKGYDWTGDGQLLFMPSSDEPAIEIDFEIPKEEYRGLFLRFTYSRDYGIYRIFLDGKNIKQPEDYMANPKLQDFDFYAENLRVKDTYLGSHSLSTGKHTIKLQCVGKNPNSKGNYLGFDSIRLRERWLKKRKLLGVSPIIKG